MNKLIAELQRLYFLDEQHGYCVSADALIAGAATACLCTPAIVASALAAETGLQLNLASAQGMARLMVVQFHQAADWALVAQLHRRLQSELSLPAPAVSIAAQGGYSLWFSLAEPVALAPLQSFLAILGQRYLADVEASHIAFYPDSARAAAIEPSLLALVPAFDPVTERWSAFIDPSMGSMFIDEPGLEMAPGMDKQAEILAGFASMNIEHFQRALLLLQTSVEVETIAAGNPENPGHRPARPSLASPAQRKKLNVGSNFSEPTSFLLAVMNDAEATAGQRIKAAKVLLAYAADRKKHD